MATEGDHKSIRVIIVDDHPMLREGTRSCLEQAEGIQVVAVTGDGAGALRLVNMHAPHVLVLDVRLPDISGIEVARRIRERPSKVGIVILTGYDDTAYQCALARIGIRAYLRKTASASEIVAAVRAAAEGRSYGMAPGKKAAETEQPLLTPREQEVLDLVIRGLRNAEIAETLGVTPKTVEYHLSHLFEKLGARSRAEVIRKSHQLGFADY